MHNDQPPVLSIDKIAFTLEEPNSNIVDAACHSLVELVDSGQLSGSRWKPGRRYKIHATVPVHGDDHREAGTASVQVGPRFLGIPAVRVECNPSKLGPKGMAYVMATTRTILAFGDSPSLSRGMITRIDLALDLPGLCNDQVIVRNKGQRKHGVFSDQKGRIETQYLGGSRSNQTVAYTRRHKMTDEQSLRIERRLKPRCYGFHLADLNDPFQKIQLIRTQSLLPHLGGMNPEHFFDSVRLRGFGHVVAKLPPAQRRAIKSVLKDADSSLLPSTNVTWSSWPRVIDDSGLGCFVEIPDDAPIAPDPVHMDELRADGLT
jgi:hypothetical protein